MPHISVIVPVYNGEKTIRETVESVLNQTWQDFEIIIINDGSQDRTLDVISGIQDSRIKVFSYPNAGQAASRNRGIGKASGEYIAFLDADDLWTADKLEAQYQALQENPEAKVAYSWSNHIDESGKFLRTGSHVTANGNVYERLLLLNFFEHGSNPLIHKQAFVEVGGFDESLPPTEDWDMWLRLAARYHFVAVSSPQILYRVYNNSASSNVFRLSSACMTVIERAFNQAPASLQYVKPYSIANISKYITYKALEGSPSRERGLVAARFFWKAILNDLAMLPPKRDFFKIWLKIAAVVLLPPHLVHKLFNRFQSLHGIHICLLIYIRRELPAVTNTVLSDKI